MLLLQPGQTGRYAAGQRFGQHGIELGDLRQRTPRQVVQAIAIQRADHLAMAVENRRGDHGLHSGQAGRAHAALAGRLPEGVAFRPASGSESDGSASRPALAA